MEIRKLFFRRLFTTNVSTNPQNFISSNFSLLESSPNIAHLRHIHARLLRTALFDNVILSSKLILAYSEHNKLNPDSLRVFIHMRNRNIYSWNIVIGEFSRSNFPEKSVELFIQMWRNSDVRPDAFTLPLVVRACAGSGAMKFGVSAHGLCAKMGMEMNLFVASALIFMYVTFGKVFDARVLFDEMPKRDAVLWTAMLAGYAQHGEPMLALTVFRDMAAAAIELDGVVMVSLLLACGQLGWLKHGKSIHNWCLRRYLPFGLSLGNAVVDMYVKSAALSYAHKVFDKMLDRDVISWSAIILGYGLTGGVDIALHLFDEMCASKIEPNHVTFLGVLSGCAHGGLVEKARTYFALMKEYGVVAELKHYACMVDCFSRASLLEEAERFIEEMPMEPDGAVLGALLAGCRVHGNVKVAERIAKKLIRMEPDKAGYYVLLSNMYAEAGRFDDAERIWDFMREHNLLKIPGYSSIQSKTDILSYGNKI